MLRTVVLLLLATAFPCVAAAPTVNQDVQGEKASDDKDKIVCKRFADTGSLVSSHRVCKAKREWERARDNSSSMNAANSCKASGEGVNCN